MNNNNNLTGSLILRSLTFSARGVTDIDVAYARMLFRRTDSLDLPSACFVFPCLDVCNDAATLASTSPSLVRVLQVKHGVHVVLLGLNSALCKWRLQLEQNIGLLACTFVAQARVPHPRYLATSTPEVV